MDKSTEINGLEIAVVGMSANLCACDDIETYWQKLVAGEELLNRLDERSLSAAGITPEIWQKDNYVTVGSEIKDRFDFDASFFDYVAREAEFMDPQLRLMHQCVYQALHDAGLGARHHDVNVGTYLGASFNLTWLQCVGELCSNNLLELHDLRTLFQNEFFASRIAHNLNLSGPAVNVSATCATSAVAIHMASQGLLSGDCDAALAGAACINPKLEGYEFYQNMIQSSDGHCRVFDDAADGTVFGNGVGVVVLKRLSDAIEDRNHIYAVLKGSAVNNDGDEKAGYTAPSVSGQRNVILAALEAAEITAGGVDFVECHGTATKIGDPIEVEALKQSYGAEENHQILLGSVKSNLGHLDTAAGVVGFIKAVLAIKNQALPKSLHFNALNRNIKLEGTNLSINAQTTPLYQAHRPLRGSVSSFGIGGTNAHLIVEEYLESRQERPSSRRWHLLPYSAKSEASLLAYEQALAGMMATSDDLLALDSLAFSLQRKDPDFSVRRAILSKDLQDSIDSLAQYRKGHYFSASGTHCRPVFLFPGQGSQYLGMASSLYRYDGEFSGLVDQCFALLDTDFSRELKSLFMSLDDSDAEVLVKTEYAQPLLFILEYALARHLMRTGIEPSYMIGHSLGEYVAACLAGVFSLQDALHLVRQRGLIMSRAKPGKMLSAAAPRAGYEKWLDETVSCASYNSENLSVFSGTEDAIHALKHRLQANGIRCQLLHTSHAYHCELMDDCLPEFRQVLQSVAMNPPCIDFYSNVTGELITPEQATDPEYWVSHIRQPVRFAQAVGDMLTRKVGVFLEVGPGQVLSTFVKDSRFFAASDICVNTLPHPKDGLDDELCFLRAIAQLYCHGCQIDWVYHQGDAELTEIALPVYQYDKTTYAQVVGHTLAKQRQSESGVTSSLSAFPVAGDTDKPASTKISHARPQQSVGYVAPSGEVQVVLAGHWCSIFSLEDVGVEDNFFELGGHSLAGIRVLNFVEETFGLTISINQLFANPTVAGLSKLIEQAKQENTREDILPIPRDGELSVSFPQQRMWFIDQYQGGSSNYNLPLPLHVRGPFDIERARLCINIIISRHEVLRTRYRAGKSGVAQFIDDCAEITIRKIDLRPIGDEERRVQMAELAQEDALRPYDLAHDLMLRISWIALKPDEGLLLFNMHHIASDGWSFRVLMNEFIQLYTHSGAPSIELLAPLPIQYADFSAWQRSQLCGEKLSVLSDFWVQGLAEAPAVHSLPLKTSRSIKSYINGAKRNSRFEQEQTSELQSVAKRLGITPFILIHAAFSIVLARFSNTADIIIGTPVANRNHRKIESLIGYFVNTLVLRTRYDGEQSIDAYLKYVQDVNFAAQSHQDLPFEKLVDLLDLERSEEVMPLVQIMLSVDTNEEVESGIEGLTFSEYDIDVAQPQFELDLFVNFRDGEMVLDWIYDADLFDAQLIEQLDDGLMRVLLQLMETPHGKISELAVISDQNIQQIMTLSSGPTRPFDESKLIHEFFDAQVEKQPNAMALVFRNHQVDYQCLSHRVNQHVNWLLEQGVEPDAVVGVYMERSVEMVVALMSIVKSGGAYVPLDPDHPPARTAVVLEEASIKLVLTQAHLSSRWEHAELKTDSCQFVALDDPTQVQVIGAYPTYAPRRFQGQTSRHLAYVIYTSGSTGKPKGVMVEHRSLVNRIEWMNRWHPMTPDDKFLQKTPYGFDVSVWEFFWSLSFGGTLVLAEPGGHKDPLYLNDLIEKQSISLLHFVPSMLNAFLSFDKAVLATSVKSVFCSGEALSTSTVTLLQQRSPHVSVFNLYGPTEATIEVSCFDCQYMADHLAVPIGQPIQNINLYILDKHRQLAPIGTPGELYIGGVGLARGYLNREQLTEDVFVDHRFENGQSARLYKTGDLCRYINDGEIEYLGRIDHQIKLRGLRIELGEIEAGLHNLEGVDSALVMLADLGANEVLAAYIKPARMPHSDREKKDYCADIQAQLTTTLPDYMVPDHIELLESWPLTLSGKVDRKSLPRLVVDTTLSDYVAPQTDKEHALAEVWSNVLKIDLHKLGVDDNFFELGGDSILCIQVVSQAVRAGLNFSVRDVYSSSTIRALAERAEQGSLIDAPQSAVSGKTQLLPLQCQFFTDLTDWHHFNQSVLLSTPTDFDIHVLREILVPLYQKHDALRLRFGSVDGQFSGTYVPFDTALLDQVIEHVHWEQSDFSQLGDHADTFQANLDPAQGLNVKAVFFQPSNNKSNLALKSAYQGRLLLIIHHLVVDGVSWRILLDDLTTLYGQYKQSRSYRLSAKTSSFSQWTQFATKYAESENILSELPYWEERCSIATTPLKEVAGASEEIASRFEVLDIVIDKDRTRKLLTDCQKTFNTPINPLLLAALLMAVKRWGGMSALRFDVEGHGREALVDTLDTSQTVGWFTSMFPLTLAYDGERDSIAEVIAAIKSQYAEIPRNGIGFGFLKWFAKEPSLFHVNPSELVFNYLGQFEEFAGSDAFSFASESTGRIVSPMRKPMHALSINGLVSSGQMRFSLSFDAGEYDSQRMSDLMSAFKCCLVDIIDFSQDTDQVYLSAEDFPLANVEPEEFAQWTAGYSDIVDVYPATGMQRGLLFHSMIDPGAYVTQLSMELTDINLDAFKQAWGCLVQTKDILRTRFVGLSTGNIHQVVHSDVQPVLNELDITHMDAAQQVQHEMTSLKAAKLNLNLDECPLMKLSVFKLDESRHRLIWSWHHALLDGWCIPIILTELTEYYKQIAQAKTPKLFESPSYRSYINWLNEQDHDAARAFWQMQLDDVTTATALPLFENMQQQDVADESQVHVAYFDLDEERMLALQHFAQTCHVTVNVLFQAAWGLLLSQFSHDRHVVFGATTSGRPPQLKNVERIVGLFINSVPVVLSVDPNQPIIDWLQQVQDRIVDIEEYNFLPLSDIQQLANVNGGLFDSLIVFENYPINEDLLDQVSNAGLGVSDIKFDEANNYKLSVKVNTADSGSIQLSGRYGYTPEKLHKIAQYFKNILFSMVAQLPELPCSKIQMLSQPEFQRSVNSTKNTFQNHLAIDNFIRVDQQFEQYAEAHPKDIALVFEGQTYTFAEVNQRANQLANFLIEKGVSDRDKVGIILKRSAETYIAVLAVIKTGACYVPVDADLPEGRVDLILRETNAQHVLTSVEITQASKLINNRDVICLDDDNLRGQIVSCSALNPTRRLSRLSMAQQLCYTIFTSGSTGIPKGVLVSHFNLWSYLESIWRKHSIEVGLNYAILTSIATDLGNTAFFLAMSRGGCLHIISDNTIRDAKRFHAYNQEHSIDVVKITPSHFDALYTNDVINVQRHRWVFLGGERIDSVVLDKLKKLSDASVINHYGPTETTVGCFSHKIDIKTLVEKPYPVIPIGRPLGNADAYILSPTMQPVPDGISGELYVGGAGVAKGYLNNQQLTDDNFISNPFSDAESPSGNDRFYRTGDLVVKNMSGDFEFVGRIDEQLKLRGYRVELAEIESHIDAVDFVESCHVGVLASQKGQQRLVAYVKLVAESELDDGVEVKLLAALRHSLPDYMIPTDVVAVTQWPLKSNGKVDLKALPKPQTSFMRSIYVAPQTDVEVQLARLCAQLLAIDVEELSMASGFFELGGHSLLLIRFANEIDAHFGVSLDIASIYGMQNLAQLARQIDTSIRLKKMTEQIEEVESEEEGWF